jgi:SAM-dependent methyltransferase
MPYRIPFTERRNKEELQAHYDLEKRLADRLRNSTAEERKTLYIQLYDELYANVPHLKNHAKETSGGYTAGQLRGLKRYLTKNTRFLEVGPGNCALSIAVAKVAQHVTAVDVSDEFTKSLGLKFPANMELVISNGSSVPVPPNSITLAYSTQLMEHLHPDDANAQLKQIFTALTPGGRYVCITPHKYSGPHDISRYFTDEPTGFHLKEYTDAEINNLFRVVGFTNLRTLVGLKGWFIEMPFSVALTTERLLDRLPTGLRRFLANSPPGRALLGIRVVAQKPA